jgi:predicted CoA-binding protein
MITQTAVEDFVAQRTLALVGVSRSGKKFGNMALKALKQKGYRVFPVHPHAEQIEGERCYPSLLALPEQVEAVLVVVPPGETERVVREAAAARIPRVWLQQGAESQDAIRFCEEHGLSVIHGECILMFAQPVVSFHRFHRWVWKALGKLPR